MQVLHLILEKEPVSDDINISDIAKMTDGFSGSDLQELCRNASVNRVRYYLRSQ